MRFPRSLLFASLLWACAEAEPNRTGNTSPPSFEEFEAATYREPWEGGAYIVNGDTALVDRKALYQLWLDLHGGGALIVHQEGGLDARWNEATKRALTYCISDDFGARKADVVTAMAAATDNGWEQFADLDFVYVSAEDGQCDANNTAVLFDVRPVSGQPYLARAFFPNYPRSTRNILIDASAFETTWPLENILAHEAGHVLGFRHEHTRPEAATCFEDDNWRPLTPYDSASTMHYPQCNGTADDLAFTELDAQGAASLYGPPTGDPNPDPDPDPTPTPTPIEHRETGVIAAGDWLHLRTFSVSPGTLFEVVLAGDGDADLYVRFGDAPTKLSYDCRPYLETSAEICAIDVPADAAVAYVALHGFTAATYDVTVKWHDGGGAPAAALVINEILADASAVDANGDGVTDPIADEMIEIVNIGSGTADLGGAMISDAVGVRGVIPAGTLVGPGEVLVLFGGGTPAPTVPGVHVLVGRLYLNNGGDQVSLRDPGGAVLAEAAYDETADGDASIVRSPELDAEAPLVPHTTVSDLRASPGRRADGAAF